MPGDTYYDKFVHPLVVERANAERRSYSPTKAAYSLDREARLHLAINRIQAAMEDHKEYKHVPATTLQRVQEAIDEAR